MDKVFNRNVKLAGMFLRKVFNGTAASGAVTISAKNAFAGTVTSESITTAAGATYTLTMTNPNIKVGDIIYAQIVGGSYTTGEPTISSTKVTAANTATVLVKNNHASAALNGNVQIFYEVVRPY